MATAEPWVTDMDEDILAGFTATNMGWLTAEGALVPCRLHGHLERLSTVPAFADAHRRYEDECDSNQAYMDSELADLGPDDHPAMHRFDGMNDEARDEFVKLVYESGWIRRFNVVWG